MVFGGMRSYVADLYRRQSAKIRFKISTNLVVLRRCSLGPGGRSTIKCSRVMGDEEKRDMG